MQIKAQVRSSRLPLQSPHRNPLCNPSSSPPLPFLFKPPLPCRSSFSPTFPLTLRISMPNTHGRLSFIASCISSSQEIVDEEPELDVAEGGSGNGVVGLSNKEKEVEVEVEAVGSKKEELAGMSIWTQVGEILMFSVPATGLWMCAPLMSLISTAVVGQKSSTELAALGSGTVFCDRLNLLFMSLSIATSNMVATSLAEGDTKDVQHQISILLFVGLTCGVLMLLFTQFLGSWALTCFAGPKNAHLVPIASKYVQIRGLSWPAVLFGLVAQSASLGMKDSVEPLKALVVATSLNGIGHLILCSLLGYGVTGAAWAMMTSQVISSYLMIQALNRKGYNPFALSIPSPNEFLQIFAVAAPVLLSMFSKVAFYSLITYFATSMGTFTAAVHQVTIQTYGMFVIWGEPLFQTAQSFMSEILYGVNQSLDKARTLIKSLMIIGATLGVIIGTVGTVGAFIGATIVIVRNVHASIPQSLLNLFTSDLMVIIKEMDKLLILFFFVLAVTPCTHIVEGTLLAGRDLKFMSISMTGCFSVGALLLLLVNKEGLGLRGCWSAFVAFQWGRFFLALWRLLSPRGMFQSDGPSKDKLGKLKAA